MDRIGTLIRTMLASTYPVDVFSVSVSSRDTTIMFMAEATLRRGHGEERSYITSAPTPIEALEALDQGLRSLVCPVCGSLVPENDPNDKELG